MATATAVASEVNMTLIVSVVLCYRMWIIIVDEKRSEWMKGIDYGHDITDLIADTDLDTYLGGLLAEYINTWWNSPSSLGFTKFSTKNLHKKSANRILSIKRNGKTIITYYAVNRQVANIEHQESLN